jgi:hypothetical protein
MPNQRTADARIEHHCIRTASDPARIDPRHCTLASLNPDGGGRKQISSVARAATDRPARAQAACQSLQRLGFCMALEVGGVISPTGNVAALSAIRPSLVTPTSTEMTSPSRAS